MSALFDFDPDARTAPTHMVAHAAEAHQPAPPLPDDWLAGVEVLSDMPPPVGASSERWRQIMEDVRKLAHRHLDDAYTSGWTIGQVFGFDPDPLTGFTGLIFGIRGSRVVHIDSQCAAMKHALGWRWHPRSPRADAPPIWRLLRPR